MKTQVFVQIVPTFLYQRLTFEGKLTWMKKYDFNLQRNIYDEGIVKAVNI